MQISTQSSSDKEIWSDKSWAINFFHLKKCPAIQLSTSSWQFWVNEAAIWCEGWQAEKGQRDGQCSGWGTGAQLKPLVWYLEGGWENREDKSWRGLSGWISFNVSGSVVCVTSLLAKNFVTIISFWLFFFPLTALVMVLNSTSVSWSARIQMFLTFCKLVAILIIIVPGVIQLIKGMKWKVNALKELLSLPSAVFPHLPLPHNAYSSKIS